MEEKVRYVFRTALWRKLLPWFLAGLSWVPPLVLDYIGRLPERHPAIVLMKSGVTWLAQHGVTRDRALIAAGVFTGLMLLWFYRELARVTVTPTELTWKLPLLPARHLRWEDADEILIEHVERLWEGRRYARRTLTVTAVRRGWWPWRNRMRLTNSQIEGYHHVESLAVQKGVPAIVHRRLKRVDARKRPVLFTQWTPGDGLKFLAYGLTAAGLAGAYFLDRIWVPPHDLLRPFVIWVAGFLGLMALRRVYFRQVAVDRRFLYFLVCGILWRKVPVESLAGLQADGNGLRVQAHMGRNHKVRTVFSTRRFIHNRGVLMRMIREVREQQRVHDSQPIRLVQDAPREAGPAPEAGEGEAPGN